MTEVVLEATGEAPGRSCPRAYRYGAAALAGPATLRVDSLWVAGGLYGNRHALDALLDVYAREAGSSALVFNGDFHWFDADATDFAAIEAGVAPHLATRGNVETELASPDAGAGCGCAYPDWVDDAVVDRSNRIIDRLRVAARRVPGATTRLAALPMYRVAEVGGLRVGIVHGDADSLAGWCFSRELLDTPAGAAAAAQAFAGARVDVFASSHTCSPVLARIARGTAQDAGVLVNNGAAGMPNFAAQCYGLATRIATRPSAQALYGTRLGEVFIEAVPIRYDHEAWQRDFVARWPEGSPAHLSYEARIRRGPSYRVADALRHPVHSRAGPAPA